MRPFSSRLFSHPELSDETLDNLYETINNDLSPFYKNLVADFKDPTGRGLSLVYLTQVYYLFTISSFLNLGRKAFVLNIGKSQFLIPHLKAHF